MAEEARQTLAPLIEAGQTLDGTHKDIESMTPPELLAAASIMGLRRLYEICSIPIDPDNLDLKTARLVGDMALGASRLFIRAAEGEFKARQNDALEEVLRRLAETQAKG